MVQGPPCLLQTQMFLWLPFSPSLGLNSALYVQRLLLPSSNNSCGLRNQERIRWSMPSRCSQAEAGHGGRQTHPHVQRRGCAYICLSVYNWELGMGIIQPFFAPQFVRDILEQGASFVPLLPCTPFPSKHIYTGLKRNNNQYLIDLRRTGPNRLSLKTSRLTQKDIHDQVGIKGSVQSYPPPALPQENQELDRGCTSGCWVGMRSSLLLRSHLHPLLLEKQLILKPSTNISQASHTTLIPTGALGGK